MDKMDIKIDGNPGTGNIFQNINIKYAQNVNPNATTVVNYNYGTQGMAPETETPKEDAKSGEAKGKKKSEEVEDKPHIRKEILTYLDKVRPLVHPDKKDVFIKMWEGILDLDAVKSFIYKTGKQKKTNFNRTLIARILHHLDARRMYEKPFKASDFAIALEGKYEASIRGELGKFPSANICAEIDKYLETMGLYSKA